ncbi:PLP-dependent cysteine synthase family protein [Amnibacterium kyonggiense]|uniref:Cystathionine beta-synthase/cysteine synthase A n=1 Tax=Amnibacterium kyonggiense TaxID=595671 RepID=A0A4R7FKU0_9MICO|nr:PLP-dependent cysteine synthase family protein [Amnibacterium kyonggiense]TDS76990.1 cystathionine beta-synthase/cysteine synthase A [Amnibacterium kyonggiense]
MTTSTVSAPPSLPGVADSVLDLIGETPVVRLRRLAPEGGAQVLVKLEGSNPGGSAKDRPALSLVRHAEATGALPPGAPIVESTSGNTGIGLALVGRVTGHPVVIVHGGAMSPEKLALLRLYGAELVEADWTAGPEDPGNPRAVADRIALERGGWRSQQYDNPANPDAHYRYTGPEIWRQTGGAITHLVAGIGTGGTISGAGRFLREVSDGRVRVIGANPEGSAYGGGAVGPVRVEGVGTTWPSSHWPKNLDRSVPHEIRTIEDAVVFDTVARLAAEEAILVGPSSGLAVGVALQVAADLDPDAVVVAIAPDSATNYLGLLAR